MSSAHPKTKGWFSIVYLLAIGSNPVLAQWMDWNVSAALEARADDNVNIAPDAFEQDDLALAFKAAVSRARLVGDSAHSNTRLRWSADLSRSLYNDWSDLSRTRIGGGLQFIHKFGLGMSVPRFSAGISSHYEKVRDADRDAWHQQLQLGLSKRLSARLELGATAWYRMRDGDDWTPVDSNLDSDVYDTDHLELALNGHYSLLPRLRASLQVSYFDGEFDSGCADLLAPGGGSAYGGGLANLGRGPLWNDFDLKALAVDDIFACRWSADGDGYAVRGDLIWSLSRHDSVRLRSGYREIELDLGQDYSNTSFSLSYRHQF